MSQEQAGLAAAAVLQVGQCRVETASREITGPSASRVHRVTPKAMAVLRLLAAAGGQVVSREELLAGVWPDSAPTDDVLTQAVTQLRKAFAAADAGQAYIETIARSGYRLLVAVQAEVQPAGAPPEAPAQPAAMALADTPQGSSPRPRRQWRTLRRWLLIALALVMLLVIAFLSWLLWQQGQTGPEPGTRMTVAERPYRLLTSSLEVETDPALSPAGDQVAYTAMGADGRSQIFVRKRFANSPSHVLSQTPDNAHDRLASWSPDGRQIAFARFHGDAGCQLMLADAGGQQAARVLLDCSGVEMLSFDFTADGLALVIGSFAAKGERAGISLFHIAEQRWQPLEYPRQDGDLDYSPRVSPDGRWLVFARNPQLGRLYRMPAGGGELQALDEALSQIRGLTWLNDSRHVVVGRRLGMQVRLQRLDTEQPGSWQDLGVDDGQLPSAARQAPLLAFMHRRSHSSLSWFAAGQPRRPLYPSIGGELAPALSADGQHLLLFSDRNGVPAVWLGRGDGRDGLRLVVGLQPDTRQQAVWQPDGDRALVIGQGQDGRAGVYEVHADGALVQVPVPVDDVLQAAYTNQPDQLLLLERVDDRGRLRLFDRQSTPWRELARLDGVSQMQWDQGQRRVLFTRFDRPGLFAWRAGSAAPQVVNPQWPTRWRYRSWNVAGDGRIWYSQVMAGCRNALRQLNQAVSGHNELHCLDRSVAASMTGFSSTVGQAVLMAVPAREGGDIGLMSLADTAYGQLSNSGKLLIP